MKARGFWTCLAVALLLGLPVAQAGECGDLNDDFVVNLSDYHLWAACYAGPNVSLNPGCEASDFDGDGDADLRDFARFCENFSMFAGMAPDCTPPPWLSPTPECGEGVQTVDVYVDTPPIPLGTIEFRVYLENDDAGVIGGPVYQETRPLDGSSTYLFTVTLSQPGWYSAIAKLLDPAGELENTQGANVGVRPATTFPVPAEICAYETFPVIAPDLQLQVETAVATQTPMLLELGTSPERWFDVMLESNDDIAHPDVFLEAPDLAFYRGEIVGDPDSEVRLTFVGGVAYAMVDKGEYEATVFIEPVVAYDPGWPILEDYLGYLSEHVRMPMPEHTEPSPPKMRAPHKGDGGRQLRMGHPWVRIYYDYWDPFGSRYTHYNNMDSTFDRRLGGRDLRLLQTVSLNTDSYDDPPDLIDDFRNDASTTTNNVDAAILFTDNWRINYGSTLGTAYWLQGSYVGQNWAYCWVKHRFASTKQKRVVGCHELAHNLGASNTTSSHRNGRIRRHRHGFWPFYWYDNHYSIMRSSYANNHQMDANWLGTDKTTLRNNIDGL